MDYDYEVPDRWDEDLEELYEEALEWMNLPFWE